MRAVLVVALACAACDDRAGRPGGAQVTGVVIETTSGGAEPEGTSGSTGHIEEGTTGGSSSSGSSTGAESTDTGDVASSSGEASTSSAGTSTGAESTSGTTEGTPDVCDDGVCGPVEAAAQCWGPDFCGADCWSLPACDPGCPCLPEAAALKSFCALPAGACAAVNPGGYCDPNGDGSTVDGDWSLGTAQWLSVCAP